jgi:hypothetical protein
LLLEEEDTEEVLLLSGALSEEEEEDTEEVLLLSGALSEEEEEDTEEVLLISGALSGYVEFILFKLSVQSEFIPISAPVIMLVIQSVVWAINELSGTKLI